MGCGKCFVERSTAQGNSEGCVCRKKGTLPNREDAKEKREGMLLSARLSVSFSAEAHSHIAHIRDVQVSGLDKGGRRLAFRGATDTAV